MAITEITTPSRDYYTTGVSPLSTPTLFFGAAKFSPGSSYGQNGFAVCQGDSGGPAAVETSPGKWTQIGINSFTLECGNFVFPDFYERVSAHIDWIDDVISSYNTNGVVGRDLARTEKPLTCEYCISLLGQSICQDYIANPIGIDESRYTDHPECSDLDCNYALEQ